MLELEGLIIELIKDAKYIRRMSVYLLWSRYCLNFWVGYRGTVGQEGFDLAFYFAGRRIYLAQQYQPFTSYPKFLLAIKVFFDFIIINSIFNLFIF